MTIINTQKDSEKSVMPQAMVHSYINDMLLELSSVAQASGLKNLASLLKATHSAAIIDSKTER